jgi:DNA invertase Pin-like site-specific DNA recombinase
MYKAALYIRLSVEDFRKKASGSATTQKAMLMEFLRKQPEMLLVDVYEDINRSGANFNRPSFARMLNDIHTRRVDCVVVKDLSRFGRNFKETGHFLERVFPSMQVRFISVGENYDSHGVSPHEHGLHIPLKNLANEIMSRDISRKIKAAKAIIKQRGDFCGSFAPYGYVRTWAGLAVDGDAACVVRFIFLLKLEGLSDGAVAKKLNEMQIFPPGRHRFEKGITKSHGEAVRWHASAVKRISENPVYTGNGPANTAIIEKDLYDAVQQARHASR